MHQGRAEVLAENEDVQKASVAGVYSPAFVERAHRMGCQAESAGVSPGFTKWAPRLKPEARTNEDILPASSRQTGD